MFLRLKKIKGKEYCYLVENSRKSRQKVKKYLGAAVHLESQQHLFEFHGANKNAEDMLRDIVIWELAKAGFFGEGEVLQKNNILFHKEKMKLRREGRKVVLALNEGYFCDFTLKRILSFRKGGDIKKDSVELARRFVDAGLNVPKEVFIEFFKAL